MEANIKMNPEADLPKWTDCFKTVFPVNFQVGMIIVGKQLSPAEDRPFLYELSEVTKIEPLKNHPNHLVISTKMVGAFVMKGVYEQSEIVRTMWGKREKEKGEYIHVITNYYDENHLREGINVYSSRYNVENTDIYFISTVDQPEYFQADMSKLGEVRVPENVLLS